MARFRKKPVVIEAFELAPGVLLPEWFREAMKKHGAFDPAVVLTPDGGADVLTLEGVMHANLGDWVIKGIRGELYPCKPDIFDATYEPVPE